MESLEILGHVVSNGSIHPKPDKTQAISAIARPTTSKETRSFLGLVGYYRKFIRNFAQLSAPLTHLLHKDVPFHWENA